MLNMKQYLKCISRRRESVRPGLYPFARAADGATVRFHLRIDPGGGGLLLANAAAMARLSPSGVVIAKGLLEGDEPEAIARRMKSLFRGATAQVIAADIEKVRSLIADMESPAGRYPILNLTDPAFSPKTMPLERPISADVPLCPPFHFGQILESLWRLGIPHVTIIAGREPDGKALLRAVEHAGDLGLITGVRGLGSDLAADHRINDLVVAGLDHLDVYCFSDRAELHDALTTPGDFSKAARALALARKLEICPVAQIGLVRQTLATIDRTLESLAQHGLANVGVFAIGTTDEEEAKQGALLSRELPPAARQVEELAEQFDLRLLWHPVVRFDPSKSMGQQLCRGPRCGGDTAIRVEPGGAVIPARGPFQPAGNLIDDDWETIAESEVYRKYRRRIEGDTHCDDCPGLAICAADCPREPAGWADPEREIIGEEM